MAEENQTGQKAKFERSLLRVAAEKMRAAVELIDGGELPTDDALADAGVLCADAGSLVEVVYDERLGADGESGEAQG